MSIATLDEVAVWDDEGTIDGLQFDGRERRIQEWKDKQEAKEFAALVERLQKRNSARRAKSDPVKADRIRANDRRHRESGRKRERERQRRRENYEADPVVNVCEECGKIDTVPYEKKSAKRSRFCSRTCRNRHHGRTRQRPTKGIRNMTIEDDIFAYLRTCISATSGEISKGTGNKPASVRTLLRKYEKDDRIEVDRQEKPFRYSIR